MLSVIIIVKYQPFFVISFAFKNNFCTFFLSKHIIKCQYYINQTIYYIPDTPEKGGDKLMPHLDNEAFVLFLILILLLMGVIGY